jgi:hypothetical protein
MNRVLGICHNYTLVVWEEEGCRVCANW